MAVSLKHTTQATGTDAGNGEIGKSQWNEEHTLTLSSGNLLGRSTAGAGAAEEISVGTGLTLSAGSLGVTSGTYASAGAATSSGLTMATAKMLGRSSASTGAIEEIAIGTGLSLSGGTLSSTVTVSPAGSSTQVQFNDAGAFGADSGLTFNKTSKALTVGGATVTTSSPVLDLAQTWNAGAVAFTGLKFNATDTASAAASLLMDLQVGGSSKFKVDKTGNATATGNLLYSTDTTTYYGFGANSDGSSTQMLYLSAAGNIQAGVSNVGLRIRATGAIGFTSNTVNLTLDTILTRRAAANLRLGAADAAAPVAQTLSVQSVVAGTTNTAGANLTITGSQGTGTGAGGSIIFQVAPAGSSGTAQNALADALAIASDRTFTFTYASGSVFKINGTSGSISGNAANTFGTVYVNGNQSTNQDSCVGLGGAGGEGVTVRSGGFFAFTNGANALHANKDTVLVRDAANTLAQRNGTNAQTFRIYNTYTDASNYERGKIEWASNVLRIGTEKLGTGTARALEFQTDGTTRLTIGSTGISTFSSQVVIGTFSSAVDTAMGGTTDIQTRNSNGRAGFVSTNPSGSTSGMAVGLYSDDGASMASGDRLGLFFFGGSSSASALRNAAAVVGFASENWVDGSAYGARLEFATVSNGATTRTARLIVGNSGIITFGATEANTVPALKPSGAVLQARLADDSGYTTIDAQHRLQGTAPASATSAGTAGDIRYDGSYIYVCTGASTWVRAALSTW